jgi:hypothetical protein
LTSLFISYAHKDERLKQRLCVSLAPLLNQGLLDAWHDRQIMPGDEVDKEISDELKKADVILLLVSPDYLASHYVLQKEVPAAMRQHEEGQARVIPVILRPCDWQRTPFGQLLATPKDGKPIKSFRDVDLGFLDVVRMIGTTLQWRAPTRGENLPAPTRNAAVTLANIALLHTSFIRHDITTA